eukprot:maker-scaffold_29-snap-gene-1.4-mRNA-1 protein AED:0.01 eAED:0.01 QI:108/1/1/1/0.5/0.66/3/585/519
MSEKLYNQFGLRSGLSIFKEFIPLNKETGRSDIFSRKCYEEWLESRRVRPKDPQNSFRKAIVAHLRGRDGRQPFTEKEENIVLKEIRRNEHWPCFLQSGKGESTQVGSRISLKPGYHEVRRMKRKSENNKENERTEEKKGKTSEELFDFFEGFEVNLTEQLSESILNLNSLEPSLIQFPITKSILETFGDVTSSEIELVSQSRGVFLKLFRMYYPEENLQEKYPDICGDVKILRTLRSHYFDLKKAMKQTKDTLEWRKMFGIDDIRSRLLIENKNIATLKKSFYIGQEGGCYPFFSFLSNGNIMDYWKIREQKKEDEEDIFESLLDHYTITEFRSIFLDRLSRLRRKIVCSVIVVDSSSVYDDDSWDSINKFDSFGFRKNSKESIQKKSVQISNISLPSGNVSKKAYNWFEAVRVFSWYLKEIVFAMAYHTPGAIDEVHFLGQGYVFNVVAMSLVSITTAYLSKKKQPIKIYCERKDLIEALLELTYVNSLPACLGGTVTDLDNTRVSHIKINSLNRGV